jgi:hypothetical protein
MVANNLSHSRKAEACSTRPSREERLEKPSRHALIEAGSVIADDEAHIAPGPQLAMTERARRGQFLRIRRDYDPPAAFHRLPSVPTQIKDDLLQLRGLAQERDVGRRICDRELDGGNDARRSEVVSSSSDCIGTSLG